MIFRTISPGPSLAGIVRYYLLAHFVFDGRGPIPHKPYAPQPEHGINFFLRGCATLVEPDGRRTEAPAASVFGQPVARHDIHLSAEYLMLRVCLQPGALRRLCGAPLSDFTGAYVDAGAVLGPEVNAANERLANAPSYAEMISLAEEYLCALLRRARFGVHAADRIAAALEARPLPFSVDRLAEEACLSPRQFRRAFTERVGVGPKLYARIGRFRQACCYKEVHPEADWLSVAIACGYTDYQHLARDFREFAGTTPPAWIRLDGASPERLFGLTSPGAA